MGQLYFLDKIDDRWFNSAEYFMLSFHHEFGQFASPKEYDYLGVDEWPEVRKWIRDECEGDVIVKDHCNAFHRKWVDLYFEYELDRFAFKLRWL